MASSVLDAVLFSPASSGTGDFVVSAIVAGYQTPASAGAVNGATYSYRAESLDLLQWEIGIGVYTVGTTTLTRGTVLFNSLGTTAKINFTAVPQVGLVALAEDINDAGILKTGVVGTARLGSGTANNGTVLRGDQTWSNIITGSFSFGTAGLSPDAIVTINSNTGASVAPTAGTNLHIVGADASSNLIGFDAYGGGNNFATRRANGPQASKTASVAADVVLNFSAQGWDTSAYATGASFRLLTAETWSASAHGTYMSLFTIALTTTALTERVRIQPSGGVSIGASAIASDPGIGGLNLTGVLSSLNTTPGTSTVSAAITGKSLGLTENAYIGGLVGIGTGAAADNPLVVYNAGVAGTGLVNVGVSPFYGLGNGTSWSGSTSGRFRMTLATRAGDYGLTNAGDAWIFTEGNTTGGGNLYISANAGTPTPVQLTLNTNGTILAYNATGYQLMLSGYANSTANVLNGELRLGNNASFQGKISYDTVSGTGVLYIDNTQASGVANIVMRVSTSSGLINALTIAGNGSGAVTFGSTTTGTSTVSAAIMGKSLGLTENLWVGGKCIIGTDLTSGATNYLSIGSNSAPTNIIVGQDTTHAFSFTWAYNATALSAQAQLRTLGYLNPIAVDASVLYLNVNSGGPIIVGTTATYIQNLGTTASVSTSTGSLQNAGGFGNAGAGYFGLNVSTGNYFQTPPPTTKTVSYTVLATDTALIFNTASAATITLPAASSFPGRWLTIKTIAAVSVVSASSNVAPLASATLGNAILSSTAGKWAELCSDGTNWVIMKAN